MGGAQCGHQNKPAVVKIATRSFLHREIETTISQRDVIKIAIWALVSEKETAGGWHSCLRRRVAGDT